MSTYGNVHDCFRNNWCHRGGDNRGGGYNRGGNHGSCNHRSGDRRSGDNRGSDHWSGGHSHWSGGHRSGDKRGSNHGAGKHRTGNSGSRDEGPVPSVQAVASKRPVRAKAAKMSHRVAGKITTVMDESSVAAQMVTENVPSEHRCRSRC